MNDGMTVIDTCKEVGIPRSTFYDIVEKNPDAITEYQKIMEANALYKLGMILFHKNEILQKVIEDGLSERTPPRERFAIYKALNELAAVNYTDFYNFVHLLLGNPKRTCLQGGGHVNGMLCV